MTAGVFLSNSIVWSVGAEKGNPFILQFRISLNSNAQSLFTDVGESAILNGIEIETIESNGFSSTAAGI